jgi:hypothetical protein
MTEAEPPEAGPPEAEPPEAEPPEAEPPEAVRSDQETNESPRPWSSRTRMAEALVIALIVLLVWAILVLDPDLLRRWSSMNDAWRLFGGPSPS